MGYLVMGRVLLLAVVLSLVGPQLSRGADAYLSPRDALRGVLAGPDAVDTMTEARRLRQLLGWERLLRQEDEEAEQEDGGVGAEESESGEERRQHGAWEREPHPASTKRALSVLSRFTPFTSLGTRRMGRYPVRARAPQLQRDYISAETRGDFSDRPSGQPLRWGR